jgi:hypothetical protein
MDTDPPMPSGNMLGRSLVNDVAVVNVAEDGDVIFDIRAMLQIIGDDVEIVTEDTTLTASPLEANVVTVEL